MGKKYVFISNSSLPTREQYESREKVRLGNVQIPCVEAALSLGYQVYVGVNRSKAEELECEDYPSVRFYNQNTYRNPFDLRNNYRAFKNLMQLLRKEKIDVIHCNTPIGGAIGRVCGRIRGVSKVIYTAHGFHFYEGAPLINRTLYRWIEKQLAKYTDAIVTMNREDYDAAQAFRLRNNGRVYYVPGVGIDTESFRIRNFDRRAKRSSLGIDEDSIVVISMGDLIPRKNYQASIRAIARVHDRNVLFLVCGKGPQLKKLQTLAERLGVADRVWFLGYRTDVKELLNISDIFLFTTRQEGLPRSMMEAMAAGLPCVASAIRGNVDLIEEGKGGYLRAPDDYSGFAEAIEQLTGDVELRNRMGQYNLQKIKQYDIKYIKEEMLRIYREVLNC